MSSSSSVVAENLPILVPDDAPDVAGLSDIEKAKLRSAYAAVDEHVQTRQVIGIGSGSTVVYAVKRLAQRVSMEGLDVTCIPTSFQAQQLINDNSLHMGNLNRHPKIDVTIDGADEVDDSLNCIKGGGGCMLEEKVIAYNSRKLVIIADYTKKNGVLGTERANGKLQRVPVEVVPLAYTPVTKTIEEQLGGKCTLRMAKMKMGPVVTDNGNFILDVDFGPLRDDRSPDTIDQKVRAIPGVVCTGLFVNMAEVVYLGQPDGSVLKLTHAAQA